MVADLWHAVFMFREAQERQNSYLLCFRLFFSWRDAHKISGRHMTKIQFVKGDTFLLNRVFCALPGPQLRKTPIWHDSATKPFRYWFFLMLTCIFEQSTSYLERITKSNARDNISVGRDTKLSTQVHYVKSVRIKRAAK